MKKYLIIALLLVAVMAVPAFASVQNVKVSGDIKATSVIRNNFGLGVDDLGGVEQATHQNNFISQTRVRIDADLTDNVSTTVRLLNERPWGGDVDGTTSDSSKEVSIDLAYVQMREMLYCPLTLTVGRQSLFYGNGFIMGNGPNNRSTGGLESVAQDLAYPRSFDAIKGVLNYDPLTIDLFAAKVNERTPGLLNSAKTDDTMVYGANANYKLSDKWNSSLEGFFFARIDRDNVSAGYKADTVYTPGVRMETNPIKGLNLQALWAMQRGVYNNTSYVNSSREAMAAQFIGSYLLPFEKTAKYEPVVAYAYTYASGDKNSTTGSVYKGWDPMYERISSGKIYNSLLDLTNVHVNELSFSMKPIKDFTTKATWSMLTLDKKVLGGTLPLLRPDSSTTTNDAAVKTDKKSIGNEIDLDLTYDYTEDVAIGLSAGWFIPGNLFEDTNDNVASQVLTSVAVAF